MTRLPRRATYVQQSEPGSDHRPLPVRQMPPMQIVADHVLHDVAVETSP